MSIYDDYSRSREGLIWGQSATKVGLIALGILPALTAMNRGAWFAALTLLGIWSVSTTLLVVPVRGRSALGWLAATFGFGIGRVVGATTFRSRASRGDYSRTSDETDLPGVLSPVEIHDGPPLAATHARIALIQNHAAKSWSVTAKVIHPGIGMAEPDVRDRIGRSLSTLLDACEQTELVSTVILMARTLPDDGAERRQWIASHRSPDAPPQPRRVNDDLLESFSHASVRTEQFVTITVPERRLARRAKDAGAGLDGRARALYNVMAEVEAHLRGGIGMTDVAWLTSPELFLAVRTGFAPGDRASVLAAMRRSGYETESTRVDWATAGPSGADSAVRHYSHDAWNSVSATLRLPDKGALMGALAPVLMPSAEGERRSFAVIYPVATHAQATRQASRATTSASMAEGLRDKLQMNARARERIGAQKARGLDEKLARGSSLITPYAVCTVTVPKTQRLSEHGQMLDASIRRAGFSPLRLDVAHDAGFAASVIPLGVDLGGPR